MIISDIDMEDGYNAIFEAREKGLEFDGVFCYNDMMAFGAMKALKELGYKIPDDVAVVGYDDIMFSSLVCPSLTTVRIKKFEMGFEAFRMLLQRLRGQRKKVKRKILDVELIVRESA